jgi:hypothetical protein
MELAEDLNHQEIIRSTVANAAVTSGVTLELEEQSWLTRLLLDTLWKNQNGIAPDESVSELMDRALAERNRAARARRLVSTGKTSLLLSAGFGSEGKTLLRSQKGDVSSRFYADAAAVAFRSAACINPHIDSEAVLIDSGRIPPHELVTDLKELRRLEQRAVSKREMHAYPWLWRISYRVPELSVVVQCCKEDLLGEQGKWTGIPLLGSGDSGLN